MKHLILSALLITAPFTLTACETVPASVSRLDEQALGTAYAAATLANYTIAATAPTMSREKALKAQALKERYTTAIRKAETAKAIGDALGYRANIADATKAFNAVSVLVKE